MRLNYIPNWNPVQLAARAAILLACLPSSILPGGTNGGWSLSYSSFLVGRVPFGVGESRMWRPPPPRPFRRRGCCCLAFCPDAFQQDAGGFVAAAFRAGQFRLGGHQLAAKRLGQNRLRDLLHPRRRRGHAGFDLVRQGEQGAHAADDFVLLGEGGELAAADT